MENSMDRGTWQPTVHGVTAANQKSSSTVTVPLVGLLGRRHTCVGRFPGAARAAGLPVQQP